MSRFEGLPVGEGDSTGPYTPGAGSNGELVKLFAEWYYSLSGWISLPALVEDFTRILTNHTQEDIDPHSFLDAVVMEASADGGRVSSYSDGLFSALVQTLYTLGHNGFALDLSFYDTEDAITLAEGLGGSEERPLEILYRGISVNMLGAYTENCVVRLEGSAVYCGSHSLNSEFTVTGRMALLNVGQNAQSCVFRLGEPDYCEDMLGEYLDDYPKETAEPAVVYLRNRGFFRDENRLYVPNSGGRWREVRV